MDSIALAGSTVSIAPSISTERDGGDGPAPYDVIVVGAGIGGLTSAALLAKRGLSVLLVERNHQPGGSCGAFRRRGCTLDLGAAMLYGFGEKGFNPHRFVLNELEEELEVYRHEAMYRLHYGDKSVVFWPEPERFFGELGRLFPDSIDQFRRFYRDLEKLYAVVVGADSLFLSPSETPREELLSVLLKHPVSQFRLLRLLSKNARSLLAKRVKDEGLFRFLDKLTSTYSYTTLEETPALLAVTMFVENHVGGTYYPAGSPMMLAARLEKAFEKFGGTIRYRSTVSKILVESGRAAGVELEDGGRFYSRDVVFGGTVWNLYEKMLPHEVLPVGLLEKTRAIEPTFPSSVVYGVVEASAVPADAHAVEMLIGNPDAIDESDVTLYLSSIEDPTLAPEGQQVFMLIGPSAREWPSPDSPKYQDQAYRAAKDEEMERMLALVERRFPGFGAKILFREAGTPTTIERYLLKKGGAVGGPKQRMGQEILHRQAATTFLPGLFMCGESTVMGTGTPAVTISGISAADVLLRSRGLPEFRKRPMAREYVRIIPRGVPGNRPTDQAFLGATRCQWCEDAPCQAACPLGIDVMGIMRRLEAANISGALRRLKESDGGLPSCASCSSRPCLVVCARREVDGAPLPIPALLGSLAARV